MLIGDPEKVERAEILLEKGTDRSKFFRGEVDEYTWHDVGSSFVLSELNSAFLLGQLEAGRGITEERLSSWRAYSSGLAPLAEAGAIEVPSIPPGCEHNAHIFWIKLADADQRTAMIRHLDERGIHAVFHYIPLHSSPAGLRFGKFCGADRWTTRESQRLLRLPLYHGFDQVERVVEAVGDFFRGIP